MSLLALSTNFVFDECSFAENAPVQYAPLLVENLSSHNVVSVSATLRLRKDVPFALYVRDCPPAPNEGITSCKLSA